MALENWQALSEDDQALKLLLSVVDEVVLDNHKVSLV